ncbi:DUF4397 domain-containing protein [Pedobacter mendelii]|uniref:DUF4397 domain-containing protein n=1 Tax=Pedobacter mendelii TaxID=1908240 RepID=A0ABQ2BFZ8_9SPHI|nr:DUF4397 domain-containing protein [Pedobacter mendelii]GGI24046.1 hypothetical protein GCM10008119_10700 [Pedobacter mendelii]
MKIKPSHFLKTFLFIGIICLMMSCVKNDNFDLDTKVRFFNVVDQAAQDFYLSGTRLSTGISYGNNSSYIVAAGDKEYQIIAKNAGMQLGNDTLKYTLDVGKNYSVYYIKTSAKDSVLKVYEDDLTPDTSKSRLFFINVGYTLSSRVSIRNEDSKIINTTLGNGEKSGYIIIPTGKNSKLYFNLTDSTGVIDTISYTNFYKGKTYTILIDGVNKGTSTGKLRERLIVNN